MTVIVAHETDSATRSPLRIPQATYRLQFNRHWTFRDTTELVPYLHALGISDVYASPYLQARAGSLHGYDISNHNALNPEIGSEQEHARMARAIQEHGMGHLIDIVPNHMGIGERGNRWWMDVLENGQSSPFAPYFDIDYYPLKRELWGKVLLPVLGDQFGNVLERGELQLRHAEGRFWIEYFDKTFPAAPKSIALVLREALSLLAGNLSEDHPDRMELESIVTALEHLPTRDRTDPASVAERRREKTISQRRTAALHGASAEVSEAIEEAITLINGSADDPSSFNRLEALLNDQAYRLAYWRVAAEEINYRRFFDINELAGVRVELPAVFRDTHQLILQLVEEGKVTGLRIDHPDGLYDPSGYLRRLQAEAERRLGEPRLYILVEKILTGEEELPEDWPVAGTVGYEFMTRLNQLFVAGENESAMNEAYARFVGRVPEFTELVYDRKKLILRMAMASELSVLAHLLNRLSEENRRSRDFTLGTLTDALRETIACFPIYRTYIDADVGRVSERDQEYVRQAIRVAKRRNRSMSASIFNFVEDTLLLRWPEGLDAEARREHARFVMKFQQLTGPIMAKGVEDTSFYIFNRLVSLNEVGGEPAHFGMPVEAFHQWIGARGERWPHAMNSTSTHDTKRSEDVRARIHVLSEIPDRWQERALRWAQMNAGKRPMDDGHPIPDRNDEYLLYQTLVGAWPLEELDEEAHGGFVARIQQYMEKATREAKVHTSWINPNEQYDQGLREFIGAILERGGKNGFFEELAAFQRPIARMGMVNSLAQTLLKLTSPGVPDIYQGQELWDLSLVDPDNRRPVDYTLRRRLLGELQERLGGGEHRALARELVREWEDGRIKMYLIHLALGLRGKHPQLFAEGEYLPLEGRGARAEHVVAFARRRGGEAVITVVPRLVATLTRQREFALPDAQSWEESWIEGPAELLAGRYRNVLTGEAVEAHRRGERSTLSLAELLGSFPVALLERVG
ncbi:malto-oligosyltrehalose synthase [soil metagenome]